MKNFLILFLSKGPISKELKETSLPLVSEWLSLLPEIMEYGACEGKEEFIINMHL